ncbi:MULTISPECIES: hypothetical protein [Peribacillus]|uniref:hypothetical protein n=1 Tax=Peribacillus TaxID=2675229 RepID=UPI000BA6AFC5|nr:MULTISPECIES: hypothetical protein [Peribacillus]MCM3170400.1 hypothetical protein [Peribacillus frigoritolerans]PAL04663.1 hypothetical protein B8W99_26490 [Peribacillus simplex]
MNQQNDNIAPFNPESCEAILDAAKTIHAEELARFSQYESKTNIGLAFVGIILGAYLTYLSAFKPIIDDPSYIIYTLLFKVAILALFTLGIIYFLKSIKSGEYVQVELANILDLDFAREDTTKVRIEIAATYKQVVDQNKDKLIIKSKHYDSGLQFATWGFVIFIIHFLIEEIIKNVQ